ncbi:MAG: hypothetical protein UZ08_BCD001001890 [Candidatus Parvibacillus calidus]|jgi:hypothetical protein|nr:MAG: hypothetical protein UZ08_BCD001001890 [Candidatus Parvibacillus calidus]
MTTVLHNTKLSTYYAISQMLMLVEEVSKKTEKLVQ